MEHNVGRVDKVVRVILAAYFGYLGYTNTNYWWYLLAVLLLFTVMTSHCQPYKWLGINTCKVK